MKNFIFRLQAMCIAMMLGIVSMSAQTAIRYVKVNGTGDGSSWANAAGRVQDAIDAVTAGGGEVWVAEGTYHPTASTQASDNTSYKSFIIPAGVTVRGGFAGTENTADERSIVSDKNFGKRDAASGTLDGEGAKSGIYEHKTILSGDLDPSKKSKFVWNSTKQQFDVTFYGNSYHVVCFGTDPFDANGHGRALATPAKLEGCIVEGGHAYNRNVSAAHPHEAYGGGIYMVAKSFVYNCEVRNCDATRNGGGIYMDGGGIVRRTYVHNCQALGYGADYGMGGGVCEDGNATNSKTNPIVVAQSVVTNCVGRLGGGMALIANKPGNDKYAIVVNSTLVNNNTASMEAGGVYTQSGCGVASATIVNNKCNGSGIIQNGVTTGRSGGLYSRDAAYVGNTVIWGNECGANNDVQYATSRSSLSDTEKSKFYHNALSNAEIADWSFAEKMGVLSLEKTNTNVGGEARAKGFPLFFNPTPVAGYFDAVDEEIVGATDPMKRWINWTVSSESFLSYAGINTADLDNEGLTPAPTGTSWDMQFSVFNSRPTIGAFVSQVVDLAPATTVEHEGVTYDKVYFVDPSHIYTADNPDANGVSWDLPARFLGDVLDYIADNPSSHTGRVAVFVKEGTADNTRTHGDARVRKTSLDIPSNVTLIGSFDKDLTGKDVSKRNPVTSPTIISAKLMNDYKFNVAHLININGKQNITIDGFKLTFANAYTTELGNDNQNGAAITLTNCAKVAGNPSIHFKNITVSNCRGDKGTVVYASASAATFENCIFHNNTTETIANSGLVYGVSGSDLRFDHCNVLRSVGHASYLDGTTKNEWKNSMFYGNLRQQADNTNDCNSLATAAFEGDGVKSTNLTGERCMFDLVSRPMYDNRDANYSTSGVGGVNLGANIPEGSTYYIRTTAKGATTTETNPRGLAYEYTSGWANGYPRMVNPTKNAGYSTEGDITYYGRATSFEPHNDNPVVNAAAPTGVHTSPLPSDVWGKDITTVATRDFGGLPDIGAVESRYVPAGTDNENANPDGQPEYGRAMYVRDYRNNDNSINYAAGGTGMSWQEAINGNAYYTADGANHGNDKEASIDETIEVDVTTYSQGAAANFTAAKNGVLLKAGSRYLTYDGTKLTTVTEVSQATLFKIASSSNGYTITAISGNDEIAIGFTATNSTAQFAYGTNAKNIVWYRYSTSATTSSSFCVVNTGTSRRGIYVNSTTGAVSITTSRTTLYFYNRNSETHKEHRTIKLKAVNGLQYAVNSRNQDYEDQGKTSNKGVYVAAGTYTNATAKDANSVEQPYAYMMKEGVNVYGGFPSIGNPGMEQRQPKEYETILQAQTQSPYVAMTFKKGSEASSGRSVKIFSNDASNPYNDVMEVPVDGWGSCANINNTMDKASIGRVLVQPTNFNVQTYWDGFTIRHGYLNTAYRQNVGQSLGALDTDKVKSAGGAGALLQGNGMLINCEIKENLILVTPGGAMLTATGVDATNQTTGGKFYTNHTAGAGVFMTGSTSSATLENCNIGKNQLLTKAVHTAHATRNTDVTTYDHIWMYGAGIFQNSGNVYNTIIHDNIAATVMGTTQGNMTATGSSAEGNEEMVLGAGAFIADGNFFNNTIVANIATSFYHAHRNHSVFAGVHVKDNARIYNSIIADNVSNWGFKKSWTDANSNSPGNGVPVSAFETTTITRSSRDPSKVHVTYSYVDVHKQEKGMSDSKTVWVDLVSQNDTRNTNIYLDYDQYEAYTVDRTKADPKHPTSTIYSHVDDVTHYQLIAASPCINTGTLAVKDAAGKDVSIPDFDAAYDDRIQDCKIDIGAYESDGRATIAPQAIGDQLVFYVTPEGYGRTDGSDPENAACAPKLQMVIDAAGRYKIKNPTKQVIVKVANSYSMHNAAEPTDFTYYATRTTDQNSTDTRLWSIQIPRGVEVWGGYTDANADGTAWNNTKNGFQTRNITANPTYFDSYFYNKDMKINATTYHVLTFTERVYDADGKPYLASDFTAGHLAAKSSYDGSQREESAFLHMNSVVSGNVMAQKIGGKTVSNRAVVDGIFVTGGNADGKALSGTTSLNANGYGGAAIVTDYAYVRNCIVMNNSATNGGGLALTNNALVSGSLIIENNANNMGGGLYVFENGATLSNGITVNSTAPDHQPMDINMAHVITSTIAGNTAEQGGGIWYTNEENANARFNSVAVWQNEATDQSNVYGMTNPEQPTEDETLSHIFYPFAYSLIQNMRASGTNNLSGEPLNNQGVRFVEDIHDVGQAVVDQFDMAKENEEAVTLIDKLSAFGFYGLTKYSLLCSNGMPVSYYNQIKEAIAISDDDILGTPRITTGNSFVEIGARALALEMPKQQLMLRLFVADPKFVDTDTADRFMRLKANAVGGSAAEYYSQMGSSFAYPFNSLQDALDYIKAARNGEIITSGPDKYIAQNLPFEILVGKGTYWPKKDLNGETESVWSATYAIPEGVTIIGGFNPQGGISTGTTTYYGRYYKKSTSFNPTSEGSIDANVDPIPTAVQRAPKGEIGRGYKSGNETVNLPATADGKPALTITFQQWNIQDIADRRAMNDNNKNGIVEPWEFTNQTIISGNAVNGETDGVYHVMTAVADEDAVGRMPKVQQTNDSFHADETGYEWKEEGQQIRLNGLIITGGNGLTYLASALDAYGRNIYYQGAGLQVDGNRYKNSANGGPSATQFHNPQAYGVGYRDIPVSVTNCQFRNNISGYGGAISTNGSLSLFGSSFEQNIAVGQTENGPFFDKEGNAISVTDNKVMYPGQGGAILATRQLSAFNTLFANNEARLADGEEQTIALVKHSSFRVPNRENATPTLRAAGGAIMMGNAAEHHIVNCDFVRNKANAYPAVFTMNPTKEQSGPGLDTHNYSQIINTVAWGNEVNAISSDANYLRASKLMVNIGKKNRDTGYISDKSNKNFYSPEFLAENVPTDADLASTNAEGTSWQEAVWFCAYEDGVGFAPTNTNDLRDKIVYSPLEYAPTMIKTANGGVYQNCNIRIVSDNDDNDGPNFGSPSMKAGFDGYTESADWSPSRKNHLVDNGNGWISQTVDPATLDVTFHNDEAGTDKYQGAYSVTHYIEKVVGAQQFPEYKYWLAIGNEKYMQSTNETEAENVYINNTNIGRPHKNLPRISPDPELGITKAYIDIGVYEYIKKPLLKPGSEVDILWVIDKVRTGESKGNGQTWKNPTDDLQEAIETLLKSRNGHKKEIRLMDGEYSPVTAKTVDGISGTISAFVIDTKKMNAGATAPTGTGGFVDGTNNNEYYAQAITIKGGYSKDTEFDYDPKKYKTIIRQSSTTSANKDYLIYVADPTVRYMGSTGTANDNAKWGSSGESSVVKTMPIQVDGVTLINDQAAASTKGSAIYYPDYADAVAPAVTVAGAHSVSVGGEVVYYESEEEMNKRDPETGKHIGQTVDHVTDFPLIVDNTSETLSNPAKLLITKTQVVGSGNKTSDNPAEASAVYIGKNGGPALIYNTVFHSNYGMPLDAWNTINVNNTFGKNGGMINLQNSAAVSVESQIHNTAMWENNSGNAQFSMPGVVVETAAGETRGNVSGTGIANFSYNSFTGGNTLYTADADMAKNNHNTGLISTNDDLMNGPNFVDPNNANIEERNFDIKPSVRLLNKGMDTSLEPIGSPDVNDGKYYTLVVNNKYDFSIVSVTDVDILGRNRLNTPRIDIGAYEFQGSLKNILYVNPNDDKNNKSGENWENAFGYSDLQNAVDLAALAHMTSPEEESYVFVRGNGSSTPNRNTNETLIVRDGVTVFGSINTDYNDWHDIKMPDGVTPKYNTVEEYIADMKSNREGVASNRANKTIVTGIKTSEYTAFDGKTNNTPAIIDGFVVTTDGEQTSPVIDVTNESENAVIELTNIIATGNTMASGVDVARVSNGLLYEALIHGNSTDAAALRISNETVTPAVGPEYTTKGYAVNVTVEGETVGADDSEPVDGVSANGEAGAQIFKSVTNSINSGSGNAAGGNAPYKAITNKDISGFFYNIYDANLNYQLTETSKYIDDCEAVNPLTEIAPNLAKFINYTTDRDILGNPRLLSGLTLGKGVDPSKTYLDRGAFETWRVDNNFICGTHGTMSSSHISAHFYPHDGSVVYVMENRNLVIDPIDEYEVNPSAENPGFLLVKEGASFYGNGRPVTAAYVAVERKVRNNGSIVAVPYAMQYNENVSKPKYDADGFLTELEGNVGAGAYEYNGLKRSDWKYIFQAENSKCWGAISNNAVTAANLGVLFNAKDNAFDGDEEEVVLRFTGKGNNLTDYIYRETVDAYKTVTLTQNDDTSSTDNGADFTDELDMGWNCFGIPYLVSDYKSYETATTAEHGAGNDGKYMMNIPHTLWLYYDGKHTPEYDPEIDGENDKLVNGDGGYYSVKSWSDQNADWHIGGEAKKALWVGEGIFTQTATNSGSETLTFYRPVAPASFASAKRNARYFYDATGIVEIGDDPAHAEDGYGVADTQYFTVNGMKIDKPHTGVVIIRQTLTNGKVRTIKRTFK